MLFIYLFIYLVLDKIKRVGVLKADYWLLMMMCLHKQQYNSDSKQTKKNKKQKKKPKKKTHKKQ